MNKKRYIRILSVVILFVTLLTFGFSYYTDYKVQQVKAEGGVSLKLSGDEGIAHTSQAGYKVIKGGIGWYKNGTEARVSATVRNGYTFTGWFDGTQKVSSNRDYNFSIRKATELVAKTSINKYKITAELDGGTVNGSTSWSTTYTIKDSVALPTPVKTGYTFLGWVEKGTNGTPNKNVVIPVGSTGDKTYVAKWEIKTFEVDVNGILDGGAVQENTRGMGTFETYVNGVLATRENYYDYCNRAVPYGTEIEIKNIKALEGRTYVKSSKSLKFTVTGYVSMTLQFKTNEYTYRFNANGGTGSMSDIKAKHGISVKIPASTFKKDYNTQTDWNTVAGGTGTKYTLGGTISGYSGKDGDVFTLYAQWSANDYTYEIQHWAAGFKNQEGNNEAKTNFILKTDTYTEKYGSTYTLDSSKKTTIPNGFYLKQTFGTHSLSSDGSWTNYPFGTKVTQKDTKMKFEYDYIPNAYEITYNLNGGTNNSANPTSYTVLYGVSLKNPTRIGYIFDGWYNGSTKVTGINEGKNAIFSSSSELYSELAKRTTGDITLTAKWTPITYKNKIDHWAWGFTNNEGNNTDKNALKLGSTYFDAEYNSKYTMDSSLKTTIPNGFKFMPTFSTEAIDGVWKGYPIGTQVTQKSDSMRYEYGYQPITYKITYNLNGGTNNQSNPSTYNILYGVSLKNPTRTGYIFDGWYIGGTKVTGINEGKKANFATSAELYSELAKRTIGDVALEARWTAKTLTYNVQYVSSSGKTLGSSTVSGTFGTTKGIEAPAKTGYVTPDKQSVVFDSETAKTIKFVYTPTTYNITLKNATTNGTDKKIPYTIETPTFSLESQSKTGYTFTGWTGSNGSTPQKTVTISQGSTGDRVYTANWKASGSLLCDKQTWLGKVGNFILKNNTLYSIYMGVPNASIGNVVKSYDVSDAQDGSIIAEIVSSDNGRYKIYVYERSYNKILAPKDFSDYFSFGSYDTMIDRVEHVSLNLSFENTTAMSRLFKNSKVSSVVLNGDVTGVDQSGMFLNCNTENLSITLNNGFRVASNSGLLGTFIDESDGMKYKDSLPNKDGTYVRESVAMLKSGVEIQMAISDILGKTSVRRVIFTNKNMGSGGYYLTDVSDNDNGSVMMCARYDGGSMYWMNIYIYTTTPDVKMYLNRISSGMFDYWYNNSQIIVDFGTGVLDESQVQVPATYPYGSDIRFVGDDICGLVTYVNNQSLNITENSEDSSILDVIDTLTPQLDGTTKDSEDTSDTVVEQSDEMNNDSDGKVDESQPTSGSVEGVSRNEN